MKILSISYINNDKDSFVYSVLKKGLLIDPLLESTYFEIDIKLDKKDKLIDFIYRLLWERVYLKRNDMSTYDPKENNVKLYISLSEAIGFIYTATPPRIEDQIPDNIKSIDSIIKLLEEFLINDNGDLINYKSLFKNHIRFQQFETHWTYDKTRAQMLRKFNDSGIISDIELSSVSINDLYKECEDNKYITITFHCYTKKDIEDLYNELIYLGNNLEICNVMRDESGSYITVISDDISPSVSLMNIINRTYNINK